MGQMKVQIGGQERTIKTGGGKRTKGAPRSKQPGANASPARARYWARRVLERHKVRNLMRHNGLSRADALVFWRTHRKGRVAFSLGVTV